MTPIPRLRDYSGPALLSYGFRPFFLFGAATPGWPYWHGCRCSMASWLCDRLHAARLARP